MPKKMTVCARLSGINASLVTLSEELSENVEELRALRKQIRPQAAGVLCGECRFAGSLAETNTENVVLCKSREARNAIVGMGQVMVVSRDFGCVFGSRDGGWWGVNFYWLKEGEE